MAFAGDDAPSRAATVSRNSQKPVERVSTCEVEGNGVARTDQTCGVMKHAKIFRRLLGHRNSDRTAEAVAPPPSRLQHVHARLDTC